jgi:hypothetical protein
MSALPISQADLFSADSIKRSARFVDSCRIELVRSWGSGPRACVIGHNPSAANADKDDPTSKWWNRWFNHYGFGSYVAVNLWPFCSASPDECHKRVRGAFEGNWSDRDLIHHVNLPHLVKTAKEAAQVFVCWGGMASDDVWIEHVIEEIQTGVEPYPDLWCWGTTRAGAPTHPMARGKHRIDPLQAPILWRAA